LVILFLDEEGVMIKRNWTVFPSTRMGKWSVWLIVVMPILFILGTSFTSSIYQSVPSGSTLVADIIARPALALSMLAGIAAGILACITGLVAVTRQKENALLVYVSSIIGALLILFLVGEILSPH